MKRLILFTTAFAFLVTFAKLPKGIYADEYLTSNGLPYPQVIDISSDVQNDVRIPSQQPMDALNARFLQVPYAPAQITATEVVGHGSRQKINVQLANFERDAKRFEAVIPLPANTTLQQDEIGDWVYEGSTHTLRWEGILEGGNLAYQVSILPDALPYIDLATYGVPNLCSRTSVDEPDCQSETQEFNLGINTSYSLSLFGSEAGTIAVNANGVLWAGEDLSQMPSFSAPHWMPSNQKTGHLLAPLWRNNDLSENGRFHAAILTGYLPDGDVFYAQWHNVSHASDPNSTARYAAAIVLNGTLTGNIYYIYDNVSDPNQTIGAGYVIGLQEQMGERGYTYAYAGPQADAQGVPPEGLTLAFTPALMNDTANFAVNLPFTLLFDGYSDELIPLTVTVATDSNNPELKRFWYTHYFSMRYFSLFPIVVANES